MHLIINFTVPNRGQLSYCNDWEWQWLIWRIGCIDLLFCPVKLNIKKRPEYTNSDKSNQRYMECSLVPEQWIKNHPQLSLSLWPSVTKSMKVKAKQSKYCNSWENITFSIWETLLHWFNLSYGGSKWLHLVECVLFILTLVCITYIKSPNLLKQIMRSTQPS